MLSRVNPLCELLMIVQKPGMYKSVSHNLTLVEFLLEAGIANSKDELLFLLLSWDSSGKCFLNWSRLRTALWRIKLPQKNRYFLNSAEKLDLYIFLMFLMKDPKLQSYIARRQQFAVFWLCCLELYSLLKHNVICSKSLSICK